MNSQKKRWPTCSLSWNDLFHKTITCTARQRMPIGATSSPMALTRTSIFLMCTSWTCKEWRKDSDSLCHPKSTSTSNSQAKAFDAMAVRAIKRRSRHIASEERRTDTPSAHPTPMERKERGISDSFQSDATHFFSVMIQCVRL